MNYFIATENPNAHFIKIRQELQTGNLNQLTFYLPLWRPGRYEMATYGRNVKGIVFQDENEKPLKTIKSSLNTWQVECSGASMVVVSYFYYAYQLDAGGSFYNEELIYINFINCLLYTSEHLQEACHLTIQTPENFQIATALTQQDSEEWKAENYYELVDSPFLASREIQKLSYTVNDTEFDICIHGYSIDHPADYLLDFEKFTRSQLTTMGTFPFPRYLFLILILPVKFYHGVEHGSSTVICLGPGNLFHSPDMYDQLLGVSSHELFHAWNILKIRPQQLLPYVFNQIPYFNTGFVAEGFTTYYGDLFLVRSNVKDIQWYCHELTKLVQRHYNNAGRLSLSVADSSLDLWIDGYQRSAPGRKSSIYVEGAMIALMLDLHIRLVSGGQHSLDEVMRELYQEYGLKNRGYTLQDIIEITSRFSQHDLTSFFEEHVTGTTDTFEELSLLLPQFGLHLERRSSDNPLERYYGIRLMEGDEARPRIASIEVGSPGEHYFSVNDEILAIDGKAFELDTGDLCEPGEHSFRVRRGTGDREFSIDADFTGDYCALYIILPDQNASISAINRRTAWFTN